MTEDDLGPRQKAAETKKRRTRERLVSATLDAYSPDRRTITFPTLEEISEGADISLPTLYNHFETRYDLHLAAIEQLFEPVNRPLLTAVQSGAYRPPDLQAEIISYVCRIAILARKYRYLIAVYIQSYFESRQYDKYSTRRISQPIADCLSAMIKFGREPLEIRFTTIGVDEYMDNLLLEACARNDDRGMSMTTRRLARKTLTGMLRIIDDKYTRDEIKGVVEKIDSLVPAEGDDH